MQLSYEEILSFTKSWGAIYFSVMFAVAAAYAYWPRNKARFDRAAQIPLEDGSEDV